ncbi:MAG: potassium-transporting ATPase subunit KdpC [Candidatus Solibacter sp.]|nr:potassium-transporting ATPase subunit KdpC [Candidatus Solibacter sp.]
MKQLLIALKATLVLTLLTGVMYPLFVTGLAKVLFRDKADGSMIQANGRTVGSALIGQRFTKPEYFHGRPSAAGNDGYDASASGGSNLGPTSQKLADRVGDDVKKFRAENPSFSGAVPGDAVTASGSGLDPHLSPEAVDAQVPRVAAARGMSATALRQLVAAHTDDRQLGVLGEPRVNILKLNLALDAVGQASRPVVPKD